MLIILIFAIQVFPQDRVKIDSLEELLRKEKYDTAKVDLLDQLFLEQIETDTTSAQELINQYLKLSRKSDYSAGIARYYYLLANLNITKRNFREARNNFQRSIDLNEDIGDRQAAADGYHAIGYCLKNLQDHALSLDYYHESLKIREEIEDTIGLIKS